MADVASLANTLGKEADALLAFCQKASTPEAKAAAGALVENLQATCKRLSDAIGDAAYVVKASDADQKAIWDMLQDCLTTLKTVVTQTVAHVKSFNLANIKTAVQLIDDNTRGIAETYKALAEAQVGAVKTVKGTVPVTVITGKFQYSIAANL